MTRNLAKFLSAPLRWCVRRELEAAEYRELNDVAAELQRRSLGSTADYVERRMGGADSVRDAVAVLDLALGAMTVAQGLVLEFGVFAGTTINQIASRVRQDVFGFDSFEGLPERWRDGYAEGHFKLQRLPDVFAPNPGR